MDEWKALHSGSAGKHPRPPSDCPTDGGGGNSGGGGDDDSSCLKKSRVVELTSILVSVSLVPVSDQRRLFLSLKSPRS